MYGTIKPPTMIQIIFASFKIDCDSYDYDFSHNPTL